MGKPRVTDSFLTKVRSWKRMSSIFSNQTLEKDSQTWHQVNKTQCLSALYIISCAAYLPSKDSNFSAQRIFWILTTTDLAPFLELSMKEILSRQSRIWLNLWRKQVICNDLFI